MVLHGGKPIGARQFVTLAELTASFVSVFRCVPSLHGLRSRLVKPVGGKGQPPHGNSTRGRPRGRRRQVSEGSIPDGRSTRGRQKPGRNYPIWRAKLWRTNPSWSQHMAGAGSEKTTRNGASNPGRANVVWNETPLGGSNAWQAHVARPNLEEHTPDGN